MEHNFSKSCWPDVIFSYLGTFVDITAVLTVVSERVAVSAFTRERADCVATATVAANSQEQATFVNIWK